MTAANGASLGYMTEERRMIQQAARDFTMKEVLPVAGQIPRVTQAPSQAAAFSGSRRERITRRVHSSRNFSAQPVLLVLPEQLKLLPVKIAAHRPQVVLQGRQRESNAAGVVKVMEKIHKCQEAPKGQ